jgi:hypothetical protein
MFDEILDLKILLTFCLQIAFLSYGITRNIETGAYSRDVLIDEKARIISFCGPELTSA